MERDDSRQGNGWLEPGRRLDELAAAVIQAAAEVHGVLGPGYAELLYERAMRVELDLRGVAVHQQAPFLVEYKGQRIGRGQMDLLVADSLVVELKAVDCLTTVHAAQVRSYLKATGRVLGLLINFNVPRLPQGIRRIIHSRTTLPIPRPPSG